MAETLKNTPLFSSLTKDERACIEAVAVPRSYGRNTVVLSEGDETDSLYIIAAGRVKVSISDDQGKEVILSVLGPGDYFGEMALLDGEPRSASVVTKEPCRVFVISPDSFRKFLSSKPDLAFALLRGALRRLREANRKIEDLALKDVYGRIARLFTQLARSEGETLVITEGLTHQEIAQMIGASREMVSRVLKELVNGGYITSHRRVVTIHKKLPYSW